MASKKTGIDKSAQQAYAHPMIAAEKALSYFHRGFNCAQSVFAAMADQVGMDETSALLFSSAFGAGLGRMRGTCGAFSGLCMVAGFCKGNLSGTPEEKEVIFALTRSLADDFKHEFGSLTCRELLHLDEEMEISARPNDRTSSYYASRPCERCVAFCAEKAQLLINEHLNN